MIINAPKIKDCTNANLDKHQHADVGLKFRLVACSSVSTE